MLYGSTIEGGTDTDGTAISITPSGTETVLHSFAGSRDGGYPEAELLNVNGTLYGTTMEGGSVKNHGTVFSIGPSGKEKVLHVFDKSGDGVYPVAGLVNVKGTLYGTTANGGANDDGTIFTITPTGSETVLYSFKGGSADGDAPHAGLLDVQGTLYGTTYEGGAGNYGTVFSITPSGKEKVLHIFSGPRDGAYSVAGLTDVKGTLYGTPLKGGVNCGSSGGCGTVFAITPSGKESVIYSFYSSTGDGYAPYAGLLNVKGTIYGTTSGGGANGDGIVFSLRL